MNELIKDKLLEKIHGEYALMLARWAVRRLGSIEDAEDLCQEVMFRLYKVMIAEGENAREIKQMDKYLWAIAYSVLRKYREENTKKTTLEQEIIAQSDIESQKIDNLDEKEFDHLFSSVRNSIANLSDKHRDVIVLFYLSRKPIKEISKIMNKTENHVKKLLSEARNIIRATAKGGNNVKKDK